MLIGFILIAIAIVLNWYMIEKKNTKPFYLQSFIGRGFVGILYGIYLDITYGIFPDMTIATYWETFVVSFLFFGGICSSFYTFFDPGLNIARSKPILYTGKTSGWLDRIIAIKFPITYWSFRVLALGGAIASIVYCIKHQIWV